IVKKKFALMESSNSTCPIDNYYRMNKSPYLFGINKSHFFGIKNLMDLEIKDIIDKKISFCFHVKICPSTKLYIKNFFKKPGEYLILLITKDIKKHFVHENKTNSFTFSRGSLLIVNLNYFDGTNFEEKIKNFSMGIFFSKLKDVFNLGLTITSDYDEGYYKKLHA